MSTKLRYLNSDNPEKLYKMIEALPQNVEIKTILQGKDMNWYAWFTILDTMNFEGAKVKIKKQVK